jgi:hypothetical protein
MKRKHLRDAVLEVNAGGVSASETVLPGDLLILKNTAESPV